MDFRRKNHKKKTMSPFFAQGPLLPCLAVQFQFFPHRVVSLSNQLLINKGDEQQIGFGGDLAKNARLILREPTSNGSFPFIIAGERIEEDFAGGLNVLRKRVR